MPEPLNQAAFALKALRQLGLGQGSLYARYRLGLASGWLAFKTGKDVAGALRHPPSAFTFYPLLNLPDPHDLRLLLGQAGLESLLHVADEIVEGSLRLFGGEPVALDLAQGSSELSWTAYARGRAGYPLQDVKFLWEPARFGWAFTLGRAYWLSGDERYASTFWSHTQNFLDAHPANRGPQWVSAQEVALRIIAFAWAAQAFAASPHTTAERLARLGASIAAHAARIPATLTYARAQENNHLLSEAVGLLTAGLALRAHPQASAWTDLGWHWLTQGLLQQISPGGTYVQHSTSYHRLMLHLALWVHAITRSESRSYPIPVCERLSAATCWLIALLDQASGNVPNLGPNDGANILPLTVCPHGDYRPVLQAASRAFLGERSLPPGLWDELGLWLGLETCQEPRSRSPRIESDAGALVIHSPDDFSWVYLRAARFTSRPGHADQLHVDLWWRGLNIALDAGTYLYNAPSPWDNSLTHTTVHNTLTINDQEQMQRAGKFLYLDWAQAEVIQQGHAQDGKLQSLTCRHDGYSRLGVVHERTVISNDDNNWQIEDHLKPVEQQPERLYRLRLHWLIPDWPWHVEELPEQSFHIDLDSPHGPIGLKLEIPAGSSPAFAPTLLIVRAGETLYGHATASPTWGWVSPTYGVKVPALSVSMQVEASLPITLTSRWLLPSSPD